MKPVKTLCGECLAWERWSRFDAQRMGTAVGRCHRYAAHGRNESSGNTYYWPETREDNFCFDGVPIVEPALPRSPRPILDMPNITE